MSQIPIEDAVEILETEGYEIPSYPKGIALEVPDTFTPKELYEMVMEAISEGGEPYKMTREEYRKYMKELYAKIGNEALVNSKIFRYSEDVPHEWFQESMKKYPNRTIYQMHYRGVKRALEEGKTVPPEVLADYPDFERKYITQKDISRKDLYNLSFYARHLKRIKEKYPDWVVTDVDILFDRIGLFGGRKNTHRNAKMTVKESRFFEDMSNAIAMSIAYNNNSLIKNVLIGYSELFEDGFVEQVIKFISDN